MGINELRSCREQLEGYLDAPPSESVDLFAGMVGEGMRVLDLDEPGLCEHFDVSVPIVREWLDGSAAPLPGYRRFVATRLIQLVNEELADSRPLHS